ncbi:MAG: 3-isopropylmalate dehydrogenase [Gammaproteobacteria bacterium]|nr:3-isopropylmalate dehydrogenase [Gammaproteobacteria bacterium]
MNKKKTILILPGDGIGPEVCKPAKNILESVSHIYDLGLSFEEALVGGSAYEETGIPLPEETLEAARKADSILLGAVGGHQWDELEYQYRPERALLGLRSELDLFANFRPAILSKHLTSSSSLKPEKVENLDLLIIRELTGGIYFGEPRGRKEDKPVAFNTMIYSQEEIERIGRVAFEAAQKRNKNLCSVDKANVLEVSVLWREVISDLSKEYPDVKLSHMLVDNAAMQLVREPKQFDVIVTGNLFGDILSDIAAMMTGSIGMLPSASVNSENKGMFEPVHGSAPDIAGKGLANPLATILSAAMMLRYSFGFEEAASNIEVAIDKVLAEGYRTHDLEGSQDTQLSTDEMGKKVLDNLKN